MENSEDSERFGDHHTSLERPNSQPFIEGANRTRANSSIARQRLSTRPLRRAIFFIFLFAIPVFAFAALETLLELYGFGCETTFFVRSKDRTRFESNREFGWQFFSRESAIVPEPVQFPARKAAGTFRVFILGESAAVGTPDPSFGFGRILEVMLGQQYPENRFEIVNAAMRGINSSIVAQIAEECVHYEPDLLILYMGNNEFINFHTSTRGRLNLGLSPGIARLARQAKSTRTCQWIQSLFSKLGSQTNSETSVQNMPFFRDRRLAVGDKKRRSAYSNFRENLAAICTAASQSHRKLILSTICVNLKNCPPLGSLHRRDLSAAEESEWDSFYSAGIEFEKKGLYSNAASQFERALHLDDAFAELHFRLAQCYQALGDLPKARLSYGRARDCDALQFRADDTINETIRTFATARKEKGILLVDTERSLHANSPNQIQVPGDEMFYDHVHLNFSGDYLVAKALLPDVTVSLGLAGPSASIPSKKECADLLAFNEWEEWNTSEPMVRLTAGPPFLDQLDHSGRQQRAERLLQQRERSLDKSLLKRASENYRQAIARRPNDWQLHYNFGYFLRNQKDYSTAVDEYRKTLFLFPNQLAAKLGLGLVYLDSGQVDEAIGHFSEAVKIDPHSVRAWQALAQAARIKQSGTSAD